jgi:hypothetical protein
MKKMKMMRWSFAAAMVASLVFGTTQAFANPDWPWPPTNCEGPTCRLMCGPDCGGECVNNPGLFTPNGLEGS